MSLMAIAASSRPDSPSPGGPASEAMHSGLTTSQVCSHTGVIGNEAADRAATQAAKHPDERGVIPSEGVEDDPYGQRPWIATKPKPREEDNPEGSNKRPRASNPAPRYLSNLSRAIGTAVAPTTAHGSFEHQGLYARLWSDARPHHNGQASAAFHKNPKVSWNQRLLAMKARREKNSGTKNSPIAMERQLALTAHSAAHPTQLATCLGAARGQQPSESRDTMKP
jgi:hypothetical protein